MRPKNMDTNSRNYKELNNFKMCGTSWLLISDKFLLFILFSIFLHSSEHAGHASAELL